MATPDEQLHSYRIKTLQNVLGELRNKHVLLIGMGGGGDIVSTIPIAWDLEQHLGARTTLAGVSWKRAIHDRAARPRRIAEFVDIKRINDYVGICSRDTRLNDGTMHIEAQLAGAQDDRSILTIDISDGISSVRTALDEASRFLAIDAVLPIDVGGDALCVGNEPTIRSPIVDCVILGAAVKLNATLIGIHSLGTDGELPLSNFIERFDDLAGRGAYRGCLDLCIDVVPQMERILAIANTESSQFATSMRRSCNAKKMLELLEHLNAPIPSIQKILGISNSQKLRDGSRTGELSQLTQCTLFFDPAVVLSSNLYSSIISIDAGISEIHEILTKRGVITELSDQSTSPMDREKVSEK